MKEITQIRSLSLWIFLIPFVAVNVCLLISVNFLFFENGQMINTNLIPNIFLFLLIVYTSYTYSKFTLKKTLSLDIVENLMKIIFSIPITIFIILYIYINT